MHAKIARLLCDADMLVRLRKAENATAVHRLFTADQPSLKTVAVA